MIKKDNYHVFDYDGTLAINGKITKPNLKKISKISNKALNTSRSFEDLNTSTKNIFKEIMTLNGGIFYIDEKIVKKFKTLKAKDIKNIINFAKDNSFNISFNSTQKWQNVKNKKSEKFMIDNHMKYSNNIVNIPNEIYLIALSHNKNVLVPNFSIGKNYIFKQSNKMIEISANNKGSIAKIYKNFIAYGDNNNDIPMMRKAKHALWVKGANIKVWSFK